LVDYGVERKAYSGNIRSVGSVNPARESAWLTHAYDGFPREVWNGDNTNRWKTVETKEEYLAFLRNQHDNFYPSHTSINIAFTPGVDSDSLWINKVLIELDGHGRLEDSAFPEMRKLYSFLKAEYSADPRIYYSGNRSFHIFVDFSPLTLQEPRESQVEFARRIQERLKLQCIDYQVYANRKLSRVPYTMHEKTTLYCVPIDPSWSLWSIKKEAQKPVGRWQIQIRSSPKFADALMACDQTRERPIYFIEETGQSTEWIEQLLRCPVADGRHRLLWLVLAPYLVSTKGLGKRIAEEALRSYYDQCDKLNKLQPSSSSFFRVIRYYVNRSAKYGYHPARLETIQRNDPGLYRIVKETIGSQSGK
jgi:hypothetical protein